jgi:uncharacterized RDD family membrane protein YckC
LGAVLIDFVAIAILGTLFGGILGSALGIGAGALAGSATDEGAAAAAAAAVGFFGGMMLGVTIVGVLYGLIEAFTGASPGKMVLKLKIGFEDGRNAAVATYFTRWAVKYSGTILSFLGVISGISLLGTLGSLASFVIFIGCFLVLAEKKQAVHDMAAKTAVFKKADLV